MSNPQDKETPGTSVPQDEANTAEVEGRKSEPNTSVPQDEAPPNTSVPQDNQ